MVPRSAPLFAPLVALVPALLLGCAATGPEGERDDIDAPFFPGGKADGTFTDCQLIEVVQFVNESTSDVAALTDLHVHRDASTAIVAHRHGPDGIAGTGDDDIFDDLAELDDVEFVGPVTLDFLVAGIVDRCEADLDARPFIDDQTFAAGVGGGFARENAELEATMTVTGITGQLLHEILHRTDDRDRTIFSRLRRSRDLEALTYSFPVDEVPWSRSAQDVREEFPYLPLTIEFDRFTPDPDDGERELSLGTDIMDDAYYDTLNYTMLRNQMLLRGRVRWDEVDVVRRLLVAAKFDSAIDQAGIKRAEKIDVRTSNGSHRATLDDDIRRGMSPWQGSDQGFEPIRAVYESLVERNALPDIGAHNDVLLVDSKSHIRSTRSRFHFDLAQIQDVRRYFDAGEERLAMAVETARAALDAGLVRDQSVDDVEAFVAAAEAAQSKQSIAARAEASLLEIDANLIVTADSIVSPRDLPGSVSEHGLLEQHRVVAETYDAVYHELSEQLDDVDRDITGTRGLDFDDYVDWFVDWRNSVDPSLRVKTVYLLHFETWTDIDGMIDTQREAELAAFNDFGQTQLADGNEDFEDWEPVDEERWAALGRHLQFEVLKVSQRQLATAGLLANSLWFDLAREFYVPASFRPFGNLLIDTIDVTEMLTRTEWDSIPEDERGIDQALPPEKVFHTGLVNEVQIELGLEDEYLDRIEDLQLLVDDGTATEDDLRDLAGANFVFGRMQTALSTVASLKGETILDRLEDEGAPGTVDWEPAAASKGTTALTILSSRI